MRERDYLREMMRAYPCAPPYVLWRAVELRLLSRLEFAEPVLDLGCGDGRFGRLLLGEGRAVFGLDLVPKVLKLAKHTHSGVVRGDATRLPFSAATFGSVLSNCVLEHIPDDKACVAELARVLVPGGTVAITVPAPGLKQCLYMPRRLEEEGEPEEAAAYLAEFDRRLAHLHYRSAGEWRRIFAAAGLDVERVEPYLAAPTVAMWNRLETHLMQPLGAVASYPKLLAYCLVPPPIRRALLVRFLRKYYLMDVAEGEPHGGWLIVARRPR
jgi:SAM-dependent methyltransferase